MKKFTEFGKNTFWMRFIFLLLFPSTLTGISCRGGNNGWIRIFNGKNLDGWIPKVAGCELGENYKNTFRVENGILRVCYDEYEKFENHFGHLFYKNSFSNYRIRAEYRFTGEQTPDAPGWAFRNSGIMVHCQDPLTMGKDQNFPVCVEVQLLGGDGTNERSTANVCSPGNHIFMNGELVTRHCNNSSSKTYHGDQWVTMEVEVRGHDSIRHFINGEL